MKSVFLTLVLLFYNPAYFVASATISNGTYTDGSSSLKNLRMPVMAQKAGGSWRPELLPGAANMSLEATGESSHNQEYDDEYDSEYDYEDGDCSEEWFFHIRSRICVPIKCPRYTKRDKESGQCFTEYYRKYRTKRRRRLIVHVHRNRATRRRRTRVRFVVAG